MATKTPAAKGRRQPRKAFRSNLPKKVAAQPRKAGARATKPKKVALPSKGKKPPAPKRGAARRPNVAKGFKRQSIKKK